MTEPLDPTFRKAIQCPLLDDKATVEEWTRCCTRRFLPLARRVAGDDDLAYDALQESWILVLQRLNTYRGGPPACAWIHSIVNREALHHGKAAQSRTVPLSRDIEAAARLREAEAYAAELRRILLAAIDALPSTYREVVRLHDVEERSNAEVAERLHISKENAAVRLHRAHRLLRARLKTQR